MGLFDIFKKKAQPKESHERAILLAMPMFVNGNRYQLDAIVDNLKNEWGLTISDITGDDDTAIITIDGDLATIAYLSAPIPMSDIEGTAQYAYNWQNVLADIKGLTGHAIVSIMRSEKTTLEQYKLFSKVLSAILSTSPSVGVYQGSQSLLIPSGQYKESAEALKADSLPVHLWVYLGLRKSEGGNSVYTYGMTAFAKNEMEVINSTLELDELYDFISNICAYVIGSNVTLNSGETLGYTADQKISITLSKGHFIEGQSLKLAL
jgi:Domain of unknown function (DUF4261)